MDLIGRNCWIYIFSFLNLKDTLSCFLSNKYFFSFSNDEHLWKILSSKDHVIPKVTAPEYKNMKYKDFYIQQYKQDIFLKTKARQVNVIIIGRQISNGTETVNLVPGKDEIIIYDNRFQRLNHGVFPINGNFSILRLLNEKIDRKLIKRGDIIRIYPLISNTDFGYYYDGKKFEKLKRLPGIYFFFYSPSFNTVTEFPISYWSEIVGGRRVMFPANLFLEQMMDNWEIMNDKDRDPKLPPSIITNFTYKNYVYYVYITFIYFSREQVLETTFQEKLRKIFLRAEYHNVWILSSLFSYGHRSLCSRVGSKVTDGIN